VLFSFALQTCWLKGSLSQIGLPKATEVSVRLEANYQLSSYPANTYNQYAQIKSRAAAPPKVKVPLQIADSGDMGEYEVSRR